MLKSKLLDHASISHGFFSRTGGNSTGVYASLNCGPGSKDNPEDVVSNRTLAMNMLGCQPDDLRTLYQVHSADVVVLRDRNEISPRPKADAMVTNIPGLALGILTADCVPILFADTKNNVIAAAHSGWKGSVADIGTNVVDEMVKLGAEKTAIKAAIGPAIAQKSYEVGPEFPAPFLALDRTAMKYFVPSDRTGHHMFDLTGFVRDRLFQSGIEVIDLLENDTCAEEDLFYSYRRMTKRGEPDYGRQLSAISLIN